MGSGLRVPVRVPLKLAVEFGPGPWAQGAKTFERLGFRV